VGGPLRLNLSAPALRDRVRVFIRENRKWTYANFLDRLAGLYGDRTAFALDRPIEYPGFSGDVLSYKRCRLRTGTRPSRLPPSAANAATSSREGSKARAGIGSV